jgi:NAD(P)H-hydrate repair Nnr-like enzyme with NAD(P)H-hydrate dehydratase domain
MSHRVYVVLKGYRTMIATPDGTSSSTPRDAPGMATGGTGDVLTGMLAAWLAQLLDAEAACRLAVYLHGAAGELADADRGGGDDGRRPRRAPRRRHPRADRPPRSWQARG